MLYQVREQVCATHMPLAKVTVGDLLLFMASVFVFGGEVR